MRRLLALILLAVSVTVAAQVGDPVADPKAIVVSGQARFTVLTPQLIRMEWAADMKFEDHASLVFIQRNLPVPAFKATHNSGMVILDTGKLVLRYREKSGKFNQQNLSVEFNVAGGRTTWRPGMENPGNLMGTTRTLDGVRGANTKLEPGLLSRDGWSLVDDSARPLFDNSEWPWVMPRPAGDRQDWYLFAHGHDYKQALRDFTAVAGRIPLPPRFAFGTWWSRYWSYTDTEFKELVGEFESRDVPLDVLVIDMDWHLTFDLRWDDKRMDQSGHHLGWSGYTWDRTLFPDPEEFLKWTDAHGLKTPLNLHPASGVQPHEERYPEMARAMGIDPETKKYVPFDIVDKKFAENYMRILHHPLEQQGVDFWWLDWQQEPTTKIEGVNPTWWLNYVHFTDLEREGMRPLIYHRWGGLGNHRYQIGFSGDTISSWESLAFQPYFTSTAANVGYGYWSHDIGGHLPGPVAPELYTRWVQYGAFSPILRTHTTKNPDAERRIWAYPEPYAEIMRDAFLLRYALLPYTYTAAREAYDTGLSICRPLYYEWPEAPEAYEFKDEYLFGDDLLVAPVTAAVDEKTGLVTKEVWLPKGAWIEWSSGQALTGPARMKRTFAISEIPAYVRAGAIIPMQPKMRHAGERPVDPLILNVFPGDSGAARIYEDAGNSLGYQTNEYMWTSVRQQLTGNRLRVEVAPVEGAYPSMRRERGYELRLHAMWPPQSVHFNGTAVPYSRDEKPATWHYDGQTLTAIIAIPSQPMDKPLAVDIEFTPGSVKETQLLDALPLRIARMRMAMDTLNRTWPKGWSPDSLIRGVQTGNRIGLHPETAAEELRKLRDSLPQIRRDIEAMRSIDAAAVDKALAQLAEILR